MVVRGHDEGRVRIIVCVCVCVCPEARSKAGLRVPLPPDRLLTRADTLKPRAIRTKRTLHLPTACCACALGMQSALDWLECPLVEDEGK